MPDCNYCEESFPDDEAYLTHLRDAHRGELSRIDRRRVESFEAEGDRSRAVIYGAVAVIAVLLAAAVYVTMFQGGGLTDWQGSDLGAGGDGNGQGGAGDGTQSGDGGASGAEPSGIESEPLPEQGDQALLQDVEEFPSEGANHVDAGTEVDYGTDPPTSGPHYDDWTAPGYYEEPQAAGNLVHSLEHGHVIVYYDPDALTPEAEASLRAFVDNHDDPWAAVTVVPNPNDDPESAYVLTAWTVMLRMDDYDPEVVRAFAAEYMGRGPENPVR